ncbi:Uncharacterized protein PBTT_00909 [Plasmodiophora brassicae]
MRRLLRVALPVALLISLVEGGEYVPSGGLADLQPDFVFNVSQRDLMTVAAVAFGTGVVAACVFVYVWNQYHSIDNPHTAYLPKQSWRKRLRP